MLVHQLSILKGWRNVRFKHTGFINVSFNSDDGLSIDDFVKLTE